MKEISCSAMGGGDKCQEKFQGQTAEELLATTTKHIMESPLHEDIKQEMASGDEKKKDDWMKFYQELWDKTPEL